MGRSLRRRSRRSSWRTSSTDAHPQRQGVADLGWTPWYGRDRRLKFGTAAAYECLQTLVLACSNVPGHARYYEAANEGVTEAISGHHAAKATRSNKKWEERHVPTI